MRRALFFFLIIGLGGAAILISLGVWQVQRLAWKQSVIAEIEARIDDAPVALPEPAEPERDAYLPVAATGTFGDQTLRVLVSQKEIGAGYRLITPFTVSGVTLLVDRGIVPTSQAQIAAPQGEITVIGNLQWPQETDSYTPEADLSGNVWFARDVPTMADTLGSTPVLIVARAVSGGDDPATPMPVDTARIPNDHLQYAITWFSLAAIWLAMSAYFVRRRTPEPKG